MQHATSPPTIRVTPRGRGRLEITAEAKAEAKQQEGEAEAEASRGHASSSVLVRCGGDNVYAGDIGLSDCECEALVVDAASSDCVAFLAKVGEAAQSSMLQHHQANAVPELEQLRAGRADASAVSMLALGTVSVPTIKDAVEIARGYDFIWVHRSSHCSFAHSMGESSLDALARALGQKRVLLANSLHEAASYVMNGRVAPQPPLLHVVVSPVMFCYSGARMTADRAVATGAPRVKMEVLVEPGSELSVSCGGVTQYVDVPGDLSEEERHTLTMLRNPTPFIQSAINSLQTSPRGGLLGRAVSGVGGWHRDNE